jgi:hypothetical protein
MLDAVANVDDSPSEAQTKLIKKITKAMPIKAIPQ